MKQPVRMVGRLAIRQALIAALVGLGLGLLFGALQAAQDYRDSVAEEQRDVAQILAALREPAAQASYNLNQQAAAAVVRAALSFTPVREVILRNDFGETLAHGRNEALGDPADAWWARFASPSREHGLQLEFGSTRQKVGELRIVTAQGPRVERLLQGLWRDLGLSMLRSLGVALALGGLFYVTLTRPLSAIAGRIRDGHAHDNPPPLPQVRRADEIGEIAAAFERFEQEGRERTRRLEATAEALSASELRYRRIVETAGEGVWQLDEQGRTVLANDAMAQMLGTSPTQLVGRSMFDFVDESGRRAAEELLRGPRRSGAERHEFRFVRSDGRELWAALSSCPVSGADGGTGGVLAMVTDATERRRRDEELRASNAQLRATVGHLERQQQDMAQIAELNELLLTVRGVAEACQVIGSVGARLFADDSGALSLAAEGDELTRVCAWGDPPCVPQRFPREACWAVRRGVAHEALPRHGLRCRHHEGTSAEHLLCLPLYVDGLLLGVLHLAGDAGSGELRLDDTRRRRLELFAEVIKLGLSNLRLRESLRDQAVRDPLTGLANRRLFDETLPRELARCARLGQPLTVAAVDVDRFKRFNDSYGHELGDRVLRSVATTLQRGIRTGDVACRYGGDEFLCLLSGASAADARVRFEQLLADYSAGQDPEQGSMPERVTFTVGLATASDGSVDAAALLRAADAALYAAKARGGHCVEVAVPTDEPEPSSGTPGGAAAQEERPARAGLDRTAPSGPQRP